MPLCYSAAWSIDPSIGCGSSSLHLPVNQRYFARFGAKLWNSYLDKFQQLPKSAFKKHVHDLLLLIMEDEDNNIMLKGLFFCIKLQILHNCWRALARRHPILYNSEKKAKSVRCKIEHMHIRLCFLYLGIPGCL